MAALLALEEKGESVALVQALEPAAAAAATDGSL